MRCVAQAWRKECTDRPSRYSPIRSQCSRNRLFTRRYVIRAAGAREERQLLPTSCLALPVEHRKVLLHERRRMLGHRYHAILTKLPSAYLHQPRLKVDIPPHELRRFPQPGGPRNR